MTKTRTATSTRTATAVALGTVGLAALAAAALAFDFRDTNAMIPSSGSFSKKTPSLAGSAASTAVVGFDTGTAVNLPRPVMGTAPTSTASVALLTAASCHSNPKNYPDLTLGTGNVTRAGFGTTRGVALIQMLNNSDKQADAFALTCIEQLSNGRWQQLGSYAQPFLEARRQRTQSVEYSPTAVKVQCFVDASDQVAETNECNNIKDFSVEAPI